MKSISTFIMLMVLGLLCVDTAPATSAQTQNLQVSCGHSTMILHCTADQCHATSLQLISHDNGTFKALDIHSPQGLEQYTAVGLACSKATDGMPYFVVQYGQLPEGCEFCEWFHIYDTQGNLLTHSTPAILTDNSLPDGQQQFPNNKEFNAMNRKLGLGRPQVQYIQSH